jgi:hypothetical protein
VTRSDVESMLSDNDEGFATESYVDEAIKEIDFQSHVEDAMSGSALEEAVSEAIGKLEFEVTVR